MSRNNRILISLFGILLILIGLLIWKGTTLLPQISQTTQISPTPVPLPTAATPSGSVQGVGGQRARVLKVIDGDTIEVQIGEGVVSVRYIGIDTPETVDPRRGVQCFGKEASVENKRVVDGKEVILLKDVSETDKYSRLLRYIYVEVDGGKLLFVNDYLVRMGFARASTYPPDVKFTEQFKQAEVEAREGKLGLWGRC